MSALAAARASNATYKPATRPVGIFFGGTSGIGQAMAEQLARQTGGRAHIILLGRNKEAASRIIEGFPKTGATTKPEEKSIYEFIQVDATSMKQVRQVTAELNSKLDKINFLVASTGFFTLKGRTESEEGIDTKLACNFYARFRFIYDLMPLLNKTAASGEDARVMSVLSAGKGGPIDLDDLGLVKNYSLLNGATSATTYTDATFAELASRHPNVAFIHAYPGFVTTPMVTSGWGMRYMIPLFRFWTVTPAQCAEFMWSTMWTMHPEYRNGAHQLNNHGESLQPNPYVNAEVRQKVWDHAVSITGP